MGDQADVIALSETHTELNAHNPWPGLDAYEEASHAFFFGRDEEAAEMFRLVRLAPLTVVYGKSGLGKTSLLQAGLYPKLRKQHYLPVHVRLQFVNIGMASPLQQVMRRLMEEMDRGKAEYPQPRDEGSLWEYLHRKDLKIWSCDNFPLTPVLVFDQFEELFSHKSSDVELISRVFDGLADLIENRIPPEILDEEAESVRSSLDLLSQRYRIILSFREDFLPEIQMWEQKVPSLLKNYLRLSPMSRDRAIEAVTLAGKEVLDAEVAPFIVDLVGKRDHASDAANLSEMVIEPVLLSLCCSRLNAQRTGGAKIDQALVEQTGQDILDGFYREALEDDAVKGPPDVALFIENYLIQGDHFRGDYPREEALNKNLLAEKQLAVLTDKHRLLRIVPHPDTTRVELIHDRLVPVVRKARDERKIKQHQEEQERLTREAQAKATNLKKIGLLITLLFLMAVIGAVLAVMSGRRADEAKDSAEAAQHKAEDLLGFLLGEQFLGEIRDVGRSSMLEQVNRKVQAYANDRDSRTALIRGLALRNAGDLERMHGNTKGSLALFGQALEAIASSPETMDRDRETARTYDRIGEILAAQGHVTQALKRYETAVEAWRRVAAGPEVNVNDCIGFADSLVAAGELQHRMGRAANASKDLVEALSRVTTVPFKRCGPTTNKGEPYPTAEALVVLSRARMLRATIYNLPEDYEGAVRLAGEAKRLSPSSTSAKRQEATALANQASSKFFERPQDALRDYRPILAEFDLLLHHDPTNRLWKREQAAVQLLIAEALVACHQKKAKDCTTKSSIEEGEVTNWKAQATLRSLAEADPNNMSLRRDLGWALQGQAKVSEERHDHQARLTALRESELLYGGAMPDRSDGDGALPLGRVFLDQSKALTDLAKWPEAKAMLQKSVATYETYGKESGTQENNLSILAYLTEAKTEEGNILRKAGDKKGAQQADRELKRLQDHYDNLVRTLSETTEQKIDELDTSHTAGVNRGADLFKKENYAAALHEFNAAESALREYVDLRPGDYRGYDKLRNLYDWIRLTQDKLGKAKEARAAGSLMVDMARIATLFAPEFAAQQMNDNLRKAQQSQGIAFFYSPDFKEHVDETLALVQREIANAEATLRMNPHNATSLKNLGNAYYGQGLVSRDTQKAGWEEGIRIGIVYIQKAAAIDRKQPQYQKDLGGMQKYLADEFESDGLKDKARNEYRLALEAYKKAARLSHGDKEIQDAIRELEERGIR